MNKIIIILIAFWMDLCLAEEGILLLDSLTFNKTLEAFPFSFIKFDKQSPESGAKHQAFKLLAQDLIEENRILIGEVRIVGYGSPENHDLSQRFSLNQGSLPEFILFKQKSELTRFGGEIDVNSLKRFLEFKTGLWFGLDGSIKELDELIAIFFKNNGKDQKKIIQQSQEIVDHLVDKEASSGKKYLKIMKLVHSKGISFLNTEINRINKLLNTKLTKEKYEDLTISLNILKSFQRKEKKTGFKKKKKKKKKKK